MGILQMAMVKNQDNPAEPAVETAVETETKPILERLLMRIRSTDDFPTVSKHLKEINEKISGDPDTSDAADLAGVILQDYALTNKLLKLVNSAYYGFAAGKVSTVTRAIVLLGYKHVRMATMRLSLFDHFKGKNKSQDNELREAIVTSFWAGVMARDIAKLEKDVDPEEAFVCAMLSQLGKLLTIYYLPGEYARIQAHMTEFGVAEEKAVKAVCKVVYEELGMAVARMWNFPVQICDSMRPVSDAELKDRKKPPAKLMVLSTLVKEICAIVQEKGADPNPTALKRLLERYKHHIKIDRKKLQSLVRDSLDHLEEQARLLNIDYGNSRFLQHLSVHFEPRKPTVHPPMAVVESPAANPGFQLSEKSAPVGDSGPVNSREAILTGIQEISLVMLDAYNVDDVVSMSLEILFRALDFNRALMFINDTRQRMMTVRFGYGHNAPSLSGRLRFQVHPQKDLFNLSIQVGKDLIVSDAGDAAFNRLIPQWYQTHLNAPAFIFLPIAFQKTCIGAFYADRSAVGPPITEIEHRHLSMLRNQLTLAIKYQR